MIISHKNEFIFIRTRKTASTSAELYLRQFCGPDDLITLDTPADERLARSLGLPGPQHWGGSLVPPWRLNSSDLKRARRYRVWPRRPEVHAHAPAATIRHLLDHDMWNRYQKIVTVRDPWECTVSLYFWRTRYIRGAAHRGSVPGFTLDDAVERAGWNWSTYTIDGVPAVDHVIRYENLVADLANVISALGLEPRMDLGRAKTNFRPSGVSASEVLSGAQARRVAELAADEIAWLGYSWLGPEPL